MPTKKRQQVSSNRPWDPVGYSRAVRMGNLVEVAGTTAAAPDGTVIAPGDMYGQTRACLKIMLSAMAELGATPEDVIRTRMFLTDISRWEEAGRAHAEVFGEIKPASTMVEVSSFLDPGYLIEIEATAVCDS
ncbi:MAG: RidA family protein [bacterium]|nr:RidA family protein [bacterium]MDE0602409.1 RidA family protein [bacterium]